jgi:predicted ATPase/DNA-binding SARP family transcriptional activator
MLVADSSLGYADADRSEGSLAIELFGTGRVSLGARRVIFRGHPKMWSVLAYLALNSGTPIEREALAATIWPDTSDAAARGNLRRHLSYLDDALDQTGTGAWIDRSATHVGLNAERPIWTDVGAFIACSGDGGRLAEAAQLYRGELLAGRDDEWIAEPRERFRERYVDVLDRLVRLEKRGGNRSAALIHATDLLRADPFREDIIRTVMRLRFAEGDRAGALHEYERFAALISDELKIEPAAQTVRLATALRDIDPGPHADRPLPLEASSFVGRSRELMELEALLDRARLVTILGAPGVGKTRLALRYAHLHQARYADGARFVDAFGATDADALERLIEDALELRSRKRIGERVPIEQQLKSRQMLIVLDNCEQIVEPCRALVARVLRAAPNVSFIVTSRSVIRASGEAVFSLAPLGRIDAGTLFTERARFARFGSASITVEPEAVEAIVTGTDGLPLALELCAARLRSLSVNEVVARLSDLLAFIGDQGHARGDHVRTLRVSLESSYRLLDEAEQQLFRRFAVFAGAAPVQAICAIALQGEPEPHVLDVLTRLVDQSLLTAPAIDATEQRFGMLRSVADFATQKLIEAGEAADVRSAHAAYFAEWYVDQNDNLRGARAHALFDRVARDYDDLAAVLRRLILEGENPELGARLALALSRYWFDRGLAREGATWLETAAATGRLEPQLRALVLHAQATLARNQGNFEHAYALFGASLDALRGSDDTIAFGKALATYSNAARMVGAYDIASAAAAEALTVFESTGDRYLCGYALLTSGCVAYSRGDLAAARSAFERSLACYREAGADADVALAFGNLGVLAFYEGDLRGAALLCTESSQRAGAVANIYYQASADLTLARIAFAQGEPGVAALLAQTMDRAKTIGDTELIIGCLELRVLQLCAVGEGYRGAVLSASIDSARVADRVPRGTVEEADDRRLHEWLGELLSDAELRAAADAGRALSLADAIALTDV